MKPANRSPSTGVIRSIDWQGIRRTRVAPLRFALYFIADDGRGFPLRQTLEPGTNRPKALYAVTYSMTDVNERPGVTQACDNSPQEPCGSYDYSVVLPAPFSVVAGTRYWLMIQAESSPSAPSSWLWRKGQPDKLILGSEHCECDDAVGFCICPATVSRVPRFIVTCRRPRRPAGRCPVFRWLHSPIRRRASRRRSPAPARSASRLAPALH